MDENQVVYIPVEKEEFEHLVKTEHDYDLLVDSLLKYSRLNYSGERLSFSDESIDFLLQMLESERYYAMLLHLQREKEKKEEKDE